MGQAQPASRPLSPHLQIWRWHVTMLASILHRATGVALYVGALGLVLWLLALAAGPETFAPLGEALAAPLGQVVLYGLLFSLAFHLAQGLRHLFWDMGAGFKPAIANFTAWLAIVFALAVTAGVFVYAQGIV